MFTIDVLVNALENQAAPIDLDFSIRKYSRPKANRYEILEKSLRYVTRQSLFFYGKGLLGGRTDAGSIYVRIATKCR